MATKRTYNIPALYKQVFGITGVRFAIPDASSIAQTVGRVSTFAAGQAVNQALNSAPNTPAAYEGIQIVPAPTAASIQSYLGTPIYEQITLTGSAAVSNGKVTRKGFTYTFPDWPIFDISPSWLIQKESVQGGGPAGSQSGSVGTVKEFIQQDDFSITIRGFLINNASQDYPDQLLSDLWQVLNAGMTLGITSNVFNLLDIHNIVITDARFPGVEGYMNMQPFEIDCLSDYPQLLQIKSTQSQKVITPGL